MLYFNIVATFLVFSLDVITDPASSQLTDYDSRAENVQPELNSSDGRSLENDDAEYHTRRVAKAGHEAGKYLRQKRIHKHVSQRTIPSLRRMVFDPTIRNEELKWIHCQHFITPYVAGQIKGPKHIKYSLPDDEEVDRFLHLISRDVRKYTEEEILSIIYQINNLDFRLYLWSQLSISKLLDILCGSRVHTFGCLKRGVLILFQMWHLDYNTNVTSLVLHSRLFRPPCVNKPGCGGSTLSSKRPIVTATLKTSTCRKKPQAHLREGPDSSVESSSAEQSGHEQDPSKRTQPKAYILK